MEEVEMYALCENRAYDVGLKFLDRFAVDRINAADDFPFPEYVDEPDTTYVHDREVMKVLEEQSSESYSLYWNIDDGGAIKNAMLFYTKDGSLVAGITVKDNDHEMWVNRLAKEVNGVYGCIGFECAPAKTKSEFIELCISSDQVRMLDGKLIIYSILLSYLKPKNRIIGTLCSGRK